MELALFFVILNTVLYILIGFGIYNYFKKKKNEKNSCCKDIMCLCSLKLNKTSSD